MTKSSPRRKARRNLERTPSQLTKFSTLESNQDPDPREKTGETEEIEETDPSEEEEVETEEEAEVETEEEEEEAEVEAAEENQHPILI